MPLVLSDKMFKELKLAGKVVECEEEEPEDEKEPEGPSEHEKKMELLLADVIGAIRKLAPVDNSELIKALTEYQQSCLVIMRQPKKKCTYTFTFERDRNTDLIKSMTAVEA